MSSRCLSAAVLLLLTALAACKREQRNVRPDPGAAVVYRQAARESDLQPGGPEPGTSAGNPFHGNALAIAEGQRLFTWYNCSGCHANGGGGMGPPLIKTNWIYGGEPANIFDTIVRGRPNGMPAWGGRLPEYQVWQLVAYVRSLNNLQPKAATGARDDSLVKDPGTILNKVHGETR